MPVSITGTNGMIMVVAKDAPYSTLAEFVAYARANPGKVNYSSGGASGNNHLSSAYLAGKLGLEMVHVPFRGGQPAMQAVLSKSIELHFGNASDLIDLVQSRELKALAVSTPQRMVQLPAVPTVAETVPGFEYVAWNGYAVTGGVPAEVVNRLAGALKTVAQDPTVIEIFGKLGIVSVGSTPEQAVEIIRKDLPIYSQIIDMAGLPRVQP